MSPMPAGWYPDPSTTPPGIEPGLRWWDGRNWTAHMQAAPQPVTLEKADQGQVQVQVQPQSYSGYPNGQQPVVAAGPRLTPDGQPIGSWGRRLAAYLIDSLVTILVSALVSLPYWRQVFDYVRVVVDDVLAQADRGVQNPVMPTDSEMFSALWEPFLAIAVIGYLVSLLYHGGFLAWRAATPGKMMLGLQVRLRERPGPLPWGTILVRWTGQFGVGVLGFLPVVGLVAYLYPWLDGLWPLWDGKRQALHDKLARTNVVRVY
ncbi:RDD family protein [Nocardioides sp.]|uniref:RDD family protein n=1 Tax=Nocardioides sp. TaxID=35761 RepID=UPI003D0AF7B3